MDELVAQLQEKTGLGVDQIKSVISGIKDFLGDKLPAPIASQVSSFLGEDDDASGGDADGGDGGGLMDQAKDMLGGMLGGD